MTRLRYFVLVMVLVGSGYAGLAQIVSNRGREFWVGYGHHQFMETGTNTQNMTIYLSTEAQAATVTVEIDSSAIFPGVANGNWWRRTYNIPAFTVIDIETTNATTFTTSAGAIGPIPKTGSQDARLFTDVPPLGTGGAGLFRRKGIRITSNVPIVAYAHIYGSTSSGATMLLPVEAWGYEYISLNPNQAYATNTYSWSYVIAKEDNTYVEITPSVKTRANNVTGLVPGQPFVVRLMKGQIYQVIGALDGSDANGNGGTSTGSNLSGTRFRSVTGPLSPTACKPIAVFAGSSRTSNPISVCGPGGGDNDNQQMFPAHAWGKRYLTAPFAGTPLSSDATSMYRVAVMNPATPVLRNGAPLTNLEAGNFYTFTSSTADLIVSNDPIMVVQFATGGSCIPGSWGDPAMAVVSPIEQGTTYTGFYRNTKESIQVNYVNIVVPNRGTGLSSLRIDGTAVAPNANTRIYPHPRDPNYSVVVRDFRPANRAQCIVQGDSTFTAVTYGFGSVEAYAYNAGTRLINLNAVGGINNYLDTTNGGTNQHTYTSVNTPLKMSVLLRYEATKIEWKFNQMTPGPGTRLNPNPGFFTMDPAINFYKGLVTLNGIQYHKYEMPGEYRFTQAGVYNIPITAYNSGINNCGGYEDLNINFEVYGAPTGPGGTPPARCSLDTLFVTGQNTAVFGPHTVGTGSLTLPLQQWNWIVNGTDTLKAKDTAIVFPVGTNTVQFLGVAQNGLLVGPFTTTYNVIGPPTAELFATPDTLCLGQNTVFSQTSAYGNATAPLTYQWNLDNGSGTASAPTWSNINTTYAAAGTYRAWLLVSASNSCVSDTAFRTVVVSGKAIVGFTYPQGCLDPSGIANFSANTNAQGGAAITSWTWDFGDPASGANNTASGQNVSHTYTTPGQYDVKLTVITDAGCSGDTTITINANIKADLAFSALNNVCQNASPVSVANASVTNNVPGSGIYYDASGATTAAGMFDPSIAGAGQHTIWYVFTTNTNCKDSISQTIQVDPRPAPPVVTTPVNYCQNGSAVALLATAEAGSSLTWYDNPALSGGTATAPVPSTANAGTFKYYVTQTNAGSCTSLPDSITVNIAPSITNNTIGNDTTYCAGATVADIDATAAIAGGDGSYSYQWQSSPDGTTWTNIAGATNASYNPGSLSQTTQFRRQVTSGLCESTSNAVTVTIVPQITNFNISGGQPVCEGLTPGLLDGQTPSGSGATFIWQQSTDGGATWTAITGATAEDYQPPVLTVTTRFRRITNNGPCSVTSNEEEIVVNANANGNITAPTAICADATADITFNATAGTGPFTISYTITAPGGGTNSVTQNNVANGATFNVIPVNSAAGTYQVVLNSIINSNGCERTNGFTPVSIEVTAIPQVTIAPVSPVCAGTTVNLAATGATTYSWTASSGGNLSATTGGNVTATPSAAGSYTYTVNGSTNGCNALPASVTVDINPVPAPPTVNIPSATYCQFGTATPLSASPSAGHSLRWYDNAALTGGTTTTPTPSTANAGTFTYYVTQVNSFSCESAPGTITITVNAGVQGNTIGADETLCQGGTAQTITATGTLSGGDGNYTFQWQSSVDGTTWNDIPGATNATYAPGVLNDTTYFRRNVSSAQCGSTSNVVTKFVFEGLGNFQIAGTYPPICEGAQPIILDGQTPTGSGPFTYTWERSTDGGTTWTTISGATGEDYQPPVLTATTSYRRIVTNGPCTATSAAVTIVVNPLANGNFTAPAAICVYQSASVTFNATAGTAPFVLNYTITDPAGNTSSHTATVNNGQTINVINTGSAAGNYAINLQSIENSNGCIRTGGFATVNIIVHPTPVVSIAPVSAKCVGESNTLTASGASTYAWTGANLSSNTGASVTATPAAPGNHTYSVVGTANGCVSDPASITFAINPRPVVEIVVADNVICLNETASFTANASISSGTIQNYHWNFDNGVTEVTTTPTATPQSYSIHRTYVTQLFAVSDQGCSSDVDTAHVSVNPLPVASFTLPQFVCLPEGVADFTNTSTIANGTTGSMNYQWNFGNPASGAANTSTAINGSHVYPDSASYTITLLATSIAGCTDQTSETFNTFFNKPVAKFGVTPDTLCQGIQNAFFDSSFAPGSTIQTRTWTFGDGTTAVGSSPVKTYLNPGTYQVKLEVSNSQGCTADVSKTVVVYLQPVVDAGLNVVVQEGTIVTLNGQSNSQALSFAWTSPTGASVSNPNILKPTYVAMQDAKFILTATGDGNCSASDSIMVKILRPINIPNAFSPNGDGINDTWEIRNLADYPNAVVEVFNRHGQPVFRATGGYNRPWDGTKNGKELPIGTYYYIIEPKNGFPRVTGYVVIVK